MDYFEAFDKDTILKRFAQNIDCIFTSGGNFHIMAEYNFVTREWKASFLSPRQPGTHENKIDLAQNWLTTYGGAPGVAEYLKEIGCLINNNWDHEVERAREGQSDLISDNTSLATFGTAREPFRQSA